MKHPVGLLIIFFSVYEPYAKLATVGGTSGWALEYSSTLTQCVCAGIPETPPATCV